MSVAFSTATAFAGSFDTHYHQNIYLSIYESLQDLSLSLSAWVLPIGIYVFALDCLLEYTLHRLTLASFQRDTCKDVPNDFLPKLVLFGILPI